MTNTLLSLAESFGVTEAGLMNAGAGPTARRRGMATARKTKVAEAARLLGAAWGGSEYASLMVHEALSTSDLFKSAAGDVFDREMLQQYQAMPAQWSKFSTKTMLRDFRPKYMRDLAGGRSRLEKVPELTPYPSADYTIGERTVQVGKFGRQFGYSFEAKINDQLDELMQVPGEFSNSCVLTEDWLSLGQLTNPVTGAPNTAFFTVGRGNLGTGALTQANVQAAWVTVSTKKDAQGNLLYPGPLQLVTGPGLALARERLLNQTEVRITNGGSTTIEPNPLRGKLTGVTLDNLPGTAWFILPVPSAPRPAFYTAFLTGYETPDIRYKNDQGARAGGGIIDPDSGSFDTDAVFWRVRHIVGAAQGDPIFTWASDGLGS